MSRHHAHRGDSLIEVRSRNGVPEQFLWRDRVYRVVAVLEQWRETGAWWSTPKATGAAEGTLDAQDGGAGELVLAPLPASPKWAQRAWGEPAPDLGAAAGPVSLEDAEREFWRVEAGRGATSGCGVYDLCLDPARGQWSLSSVLD